MCNKIDSFFKKHFVFYDSVKIIIWTFFFFLLLSGYSTFAEVNYEDIVSMLFPAYVSLCGFLITALAVLISFRDGPKVQQFQKKKPFKQVFDIFHSALVWLALLAVFSVVLSFIEIEKQAYLFFVIIGIIAPMIKIKRSMWILKMMFYLSIDQVKK